MSDLSTKLQLPFLAAGQAQKHVTVNESLLRLDALVQCAAESKSISAEPGSPSEGQIYILPSGKTGTNWSAMADNALAYYRDGAWDEITAREGFLVYLNDTDLLARFDGAQWVVDYETGTWTPTFTFATPGNLAVTYSTQSGRYVRYRDQVHVQGRLVCTPTFSTASGELRLASLPFATITDSNNRSTGALASLGGVTFGANDKQVGATLNSNVSYLSLGMTVTATTGRQITPSDLVSGATFAVNFAAEYIKA